MRLVTEVGREQALARVLHPVLQDYDVMLIDCQPSLGLLTVNALTASDGVVIPLECEYFALRGVALLKETIEKVRDRTNVRLQIIGLLGTMYDSRTLHGREVLQTLVEGWGDLVFHTVIRRTIKFSDSTVAGEPITEFATTSPGADVVPAAGQRGAESMPRRVNLPGADELFRATSLTVTRSGRRRRPTPRTVTRTSPSGRVKHDEKMTVYLTSEELLAIEQARLKLRGELGRNVDRGRLVRAALAIALGDLEARGTDSEIARRLSAS